MVSSLVSRLVILVFGTLYPAYASYKAVKTKNVKEHVKWMMYWIVFALFTCVETITDVLFSWFPFYYEIKIIIVIWLLSPATRGSSILYRKFVHPTLASKEQEIDDYIAKAKERSYKQVLDLGSKGVNVLMQTAIKNFGLSTSSLVLVPSLSESALSDSTRGRATRDESDGQAARNAVIVRSQSAHQVAMMTIDERPSEDGDSNDDSEMLHYENTRSKARRKATIIKEQNERVYSSDDDEVISTLCESPVVDKKVAKNSRNTRAKAKTVTKRSTRKIKTEIYDLDD